MDIEALARSRDLSKQVSKELEEAINEAEKTQTIKVETTFQSVINQPSLIGISSTSAIQPTAITSSVAETSFNSFTINLPRPALNVKSIQLLSMNAPQAQVNIPDNALCFWFYKMATQNFRWQEYDSETTYVPGDNISIFDAENSIWNSWRAVETNTASEPALDNDNWVKTSTFKYESPNIFNLFCVRLLPSYYKEELVFNNGGFNRTFTSYEDLQTEIQKATSAIDLTLLFGATNVLTDVTEFSEYTPVANPEEISITFNPTKNKFIFQGTYTNQPNQPPIWNENTLYPPQSLVRYTPEGGDVAIYVNYSAERTYPPDNASPTTSWVIYYDDNTTIWNTYLLSGYNDPNVIKLQGEAVKLEWNPYHLFQAGSVGIYYNDILWKNAYLSINQQPPDGIWDNLTKYKVGDVVAWNDSIWRNYRCIQANDGTLPDNEDYWTLIEVYNNPWFPDELEFTTGYFSGLNYISKTYDFRDPFQPTRVLGIPGQPFTRISSQLQPTINNQTLNRILGFTWDGANMQTSFTQLPDLDDKIAFGSLLTLFINRLRPVPTYAYAFPQQPVLLEAYTQSPIISLYYYTADSFCNLVYSSTITVYTRILGGSTTDTVRNTNLLGIMPLNCGNLGVTFSANFIDNPLVKVDNDIYSIEFEFRTDNNQLYWFSNNAVITLQLKLTYE
jgi:hypothetical protein